jgi:hypothetical protein
MQSTSRIFTGVSGSPGSVHALRHAAGLACHHDALLIPLLTWVPPESDLLVVGAGRKARCGGWAARPAATAWPTPTARALDMSLPALAQEAGHGHRGWAFRHSQVIRDST